MRVQRQCVIDADRDQVWKVVSDPGCYPDFMASLNRFETLTDGPAGLGSRYTVHWKVGSVPIGGTVEVVEFDPPRELSWTALTGVSQRGRFRLRDTDDGRTKVTFRLSYESAGNLLGLIADRVAARQVARNMSRTLTNLGRMVEGER
nr:SRPBCC family protein [Mycolicibacterium malmesburyense]CRL72796.1 polyketide cyclase/dehydrase and lipid transport [Mycolicibacterium malmesburyense]